MLRVGLILGCSFVALATVGALIVGPVAIPLALVACVFAALPVLAFSRVSDERPWNRTGEPERSDQEDGS